MSDGRVRAVIPMKPLEASKGRLARALGPWHRAMLSLWMLERVIVAARECAAIGEVAVVGGDAAVSGLCREVGVSWEPDPAGELNATLEACRQAACAQGSGGMLYLAGDLPALSAEEVAALLGSARGGELVLGPGVRGGTNAILIPCGVDFRFQLGQGSFRRHAAQAACSSPAWRTYRSPGVESDVDEPEDVARLERLEPDLWRLAARMERLLARSGASAAGVS